MAGVQAEPEPGVAAGGVDQRRELLDRAPERAAGAGRVLEMQRAALALGERLADQRAGARDRGERSSGLGGARMQHDGGRADRRAGLQRVDERCERFGAYVAVLAGAVEQVDGVDQDRVDGARVHRRAERRDVLGRGRPVGFHVRGDWLKIWIAVQPRSSAALDRLGKPAGGGDVGADQHAGDYEGARRRASGACENAGAGAERPRGKTIKEG